MEETSHILRQVVVCQGINCRRNGAQEVMAKLRQELASETTIRIGQYICFGACTVAPNIVVLPDRHWYSYVMPAYVKDLATAIRRGEELPGLANHVRAEVRAAVFRSLLDGSKGAGHASLPFP